MDIDFSAAFLMEGSFIQFLTKLKFDQWKLISKKFPTKKIE